MKLIISKKTNLEYYYNEEGDFHSKEGTIKEEELKSSSKTVNGINNKEYLITDTNNYDMRIKIKRGAQIITPKDMGYIITRTGITKNSSILEAGSGSGAATITFAQLCNKVKTYEIKEEHYKITKKNIEKFNLNNVELVFDNIFDNIEKENPVDLLFLDLPSPETIFDKDLNCLKKGHYIVCYIPSIIQIIDLEKKIYGNENYFIEEISEINKREWKITDRISRPHFRKEIDHTAFLVFIRKI